MALIRDKPRRAAENPEQMSSVLEPQLRPSPVIRVMVAGLRGFPDVQGGVETHSQELYPRLAWLGCRVEVTVRSHFASRHRNTWNGVSFRRLWSPRSKGVEAFMHTFLAVLYAGFRRPDILHIHAIGPGVFTLLARLLRLRVVMTHHGADYQRAKWGWSARQLLRLGEHLGVRHALGCIAVSQAIAEDLRARFGVRVDYIPNGVAPAALAESTGALDRLGLQAGRYVLMVGRLVPEKRHQDLIRGFEAARLAGWKLVLVGTAQQGDRYLQSLEQFAERNDQVVLAGFRTGLELAEIYSHAGIFVLPSAHEGLPIALLEALSYGLRAVASDIPANLEVGLPSEQYFPLGDTAALARLLAHYAVRPLTAVQRAEIREATGLHYDWMHIARQTMRVYERVLDREPTPAAEGREPSQVGH